MKWLSSLSVRSSFLSTLSLRRATSIHQLRPVPPLDFYPRSPCGERLLIPTIQLFSTDISIHALLAESDAPWLARLASHFDFYPRSPCGERPFEKFEGVMVTKISIHALLAESDRLCRMLYSCPGNFYPRSPCGERQARRESRQQPAGISIHALLAESDNQQPAGTTRTTYFYPRSPCGERPGLGVGLYLVTEISIHALLAESDPIIQEITVLTVAFLSTLSLRRATSADCNYRSAHPDFYPRSPCGERRLFRPFCS